MDAFDAWREYINKNKTDGMPKVDTEPYKLVEKHTNCTVYVSRGVTSGSVDISWERTDDTESFIFDEEASADINNPNEAEMKIYCEEVPDDEGEEED